MEDKKEEIKKINYYLKQIDGNLFIVSENEKPNRDDYVVNDNNALVKEKYFLDLKQWESSRKIYECDKSQVAMFFKLVTEEGVSLAQLNERLEDGILMPDGRIEIKKLEDDKEYAFLKHVYII